MLRVGRRIHKYFIVAINYIYNTITLLEHENHHDLLRQSSHHCSVLPTSDSSLLLQLIEDWIKVTEHNRTDQVVDQSKVTIIWSIAVAIFCVGGMIGGAITGIVAERFGRKGGLLLNNVLVAVAAIFEGAKSQY